jgi:hypothetical protein
MIGQSCAEPSIASSTIVPKNTGSAVVEAGSLQTKDDVTMGNQAAGTILLL